MKLCKFQIGFQVESQVFTQVPRSRNPCTTVEANVCTPVWIKLYSGLRDHIFSKVVEL